MAVMDYTDKQRALADKVIKHIRDNNNMVYDCDYWPMIKEGFAETDPFPDCVHHMLINDGIIKVVGSTFQLTPKGRDEVRTVGAYRRNKRTWDWVDKATRVLTLAKLVIWLAGLLTGYVLRIITENL